jgi:hypothetical protein
MLFYFIFFHVNFFSSLHFFFWDFCYFSNCLWWVQKEALKKPSLLSHMGYLGLGGLHMSRLMITFALSLVYFTGGDIPKMWGQIPLPVHFRHFNLGMLSFWGFTFHLIEDLLQKGFSFSNLWQKFEGESTFTLVPS